LSRILGKIAATALAATVISALCASPAAAAPPPQHTLADIPLPAGAVRVPVAKGSFGAFLRELPLRPPGTPVRLFNGKLKGNQRAHQAVVDMDLIGRNLQQCADALIRLRADYLWAAGRAADVAFRLTNGMNVPWKRWAAGERVRVKRGRHTRWVKGKKVKGRRAFRRYLQFIMVYAGTASIAKQLRRPKLAAVQPGDILVQGGFPGHAVMVLDMATLPGGERLTVLGQSYMPAQDFHVLANLREPRITPWVRLEQLKTGLDTPEWGPFRTRDLRTW